MNRLLYLPALLILVTGCSTRYVNRGTGEETLHTHPSLTPEVTYHLHTKNWQPSPSCIAIPPLKAKDADIGKLELVRRGLYAHLAPKGYRLVELSRMDAWLAQQGKTPDWTRLNEVLQCQYMLEGEITEFGNHFYGIFSKVSLGARLRLVRASDGAILWDGEHTATLQDGGLPISPIGAASGVFSAGRNLADEQTYRVIDDLARRLMNTLPDATPALQAKPRLNLQEWLASLPEPEREAALLDLFKRNELSSQEQETAYRLLTQVANKGRHWRAWAEYRLQHEDAPGALELLRKAADIVPEEPETWALQSRALTRMNRLDDADASILKAISLNASNPEYYETLAWTSSRRALPKRARAAIDKALQLDPKRPWSWRNKAILDFNEGHWNAALESFSTAARLYREQGQTAQVEHILRDIDDLKTHLGAKTILERKASLIPAQLATPAPTSIPPIGE